jgi:pimeloyl-ACP methyl ester carboxylesterase
MSKIETAGSTPISGGAVERFVDVNGVRLRYLRAGEGSPVVLLHGYTQTSHIMEEAPNEVIPAIMDFVN